MEEAFVIAGILVLSIIITLASVFITCSLCRKKHIKKRIQKKHPPLKAEAEKKKSSDSIKKKKYEPVLTEEEEERHMVCAAADSPYIIAKLHGQGQRETQQDAFAISETEKEGVLREKGLLAIIADGMGGLENGDDASMTATVSMLKRFEKIPVQEHQNLAHSLRMMVYQVNDDVNRFIGREQYGKCGTTLAAVYLKKNELGYVSVGDSGIFVYRRESSRLTLLNKRHNYAALLEEKVRKGEMTAEEAAQCPHKAALTSYIGAGHIAQLDSNEEPVLLKKGDRILLMSDGVFGTLKLREIEKLMKYRLEVSACRIQEMIEKKEKQGQDNYTAVLIELNEDFGGSVADEKEKEGKIDQSSNTFGQGQP